LDSHCLVAHRQLGAKQTIRRNISDAGCTYRVFKRECIAHVKFFKGAHRFLPTLIKMEGFRVVEVPGSTNPRFSGTSHYGIWNRLFKAFRDLLAVRWMKSRQRILIGGRYENPHPNLSLVKGEAKR
jgi:hypothetical protein